MRLRYQPIGNTSWAALSQLDTWTAHVLKERSVNSWERSANDREWNESGRFEGSKMGLTFTTAFIAGMLSFISPCILPLAPGYVAMISGVSVEELRERQHGILWRVLLNALLFILGFSILFVALGASAVAAGGALFPLSPGPP